MAEYTQRSKSESQTPQAQTPQTRTCTPFGGANLPDHIVNGNFDYPSISSGVTPIQQVLYVYPVSGYKSFNGGPRALIPGFCRSQFGWSSTETTTDTGVNDQRIEMQKWRGNQHAELVALTPGTSIYQDVKTTPGAVYKWSLKHASRFSYAHLPSYQGPPDEMQVLLGPPSGSGVAQTATRETSNGGGDVAGEVGHGGDPTIIATKNPANTPENSSMTGGTNDFSGAWETYTGTYRVPADQTVTRFSFKSIRSTSINAGNEVDDISFKVTYPLSYDANGGTGTVPTGVDAVHQTGGCAAQHDSGESIALPTGAEGECWNGDLTREGTKFVGWSTTKYADPFNTIAEAKDATVSTLTMPADAQMLYAVWVKAYTVEFWTQMNTAGVASPNLMDTQMVAGGEKPEMPTPPATYNLGIKFMGWGTAQNDLDAGEGKMTKFDQTAPITGDVKVWTLWGYEDTAPGYQRTCTMGIDTVKTCFPDTALAGAVLASTDIQHASSASSIWTQRDALNTGRVNAKAFPHDGEDTPLSVSELDGMQTLTGIGSLHLTGAAANHAFDDNSVNLHQLKYLSKMGNLFLSNDKISDLSNLSGLSQLTTLHLTDNAISNLSSLVPSSGSLPKIEELYLDDNQIQDLRPLASLTTMKTLKLKRNNISDITPLTSMTGIWALYLDNNQISNISSITHAHYQWIDQLGLSSNKISDISALRDGTSITQLWLHSNQISDVSPLAGLTELKTLYIGTNHIYDISSLKNLTSLDKNGASQADCSTGTSSFCADSQTVTLPALVADPGLSMHTAVTVRKVDGTVSGSAVEPTSTTPTSPSAAQFDGQGKQMTWAGPMDYNDDGSPRDLKQEFNTTADFVDANGDPSTTGVFSGTITEPYTVAKHTVSFDPGQDGTLPSSQPASVSVHSGYTVAHENQTPTSKPSRPGHHFTGWYCSAAVTGVCDKGDLFDFSNTKVIRDVPLEARWEQMLSAVPLTGISALGALLPYILLAGAALTWGAVLALRRQLISR
ncbi:leucine-rich repeat domain-containing protein [Bifidobacterium sp. ESL0800]|uniref:leucine-rich repeat domain-containing protein n=1 Tax=Bifidobacterium sp. ESL0800 TaxID=2983236 RepID=UPI0023F69D6E|nr:leucine-rich repeat domain-containing protein [Bifidobacterium sp. ESL0800]WEV75382.1 leucine-rich repeat domain-containing protein [Bifidobacterium sp. ESL0800]